MTRSAYMVQSATSGVAHKKLDGVGRRRILEDRFLQRELTGYANYAQRTRFRLLPRIW
jgi:hypothetical protein